ncbi:MAG: TRAP transporter small permease subunit [Candidatus Adiutrix sp.]|jgi:TRAP-type C4-dicarboxylate transport system permease small subunit|nr:TRAP transporter small permease subunit [Candidatus Adiutrix sp.]
MNGIRKLIDGINWFTDRIVARIFAWMILGLMLLILADVITRYLPFMRPLAMSDEFGGYALVAITMGGLGYAWHQGYHVKVEFFLNMIPPKVAWMLTTITTVVAFGFTLIITYAAWEHIQQAFLFKTRSNSWMRTVVAYPQLSMIIGLILLDLQLLAEVLDRLFMGRGKSVPATAEKGATETALVAE